jgi:hypothetical protein
VNAYVNEVAGDVRDPLEEEAEGVEEPAETSAA